MPVYRPLPHDECSSCHADPHRGGLGATCTKCHETGGFEIVARVELRGRRPVVAWDGTLPVDPSLGELAFLDLRLDDRAGRPLAANRYLVAAGADLGAMLRLPPATLAVWPSILKTAFTSPLTDRSSRSSSLP